MNLFQNISFYFINYPTNLINIIGLYIVLNLLIKILYKINLFDKILYKSLFLILLISIIIASIILLDFDPTNRVIYLFEMLIWLLILFSIIFNLSKINKNRFRLDKIEFQLIVLYLMYVVLIYTFIIIRQPNYLFTFDNFGEISNFYFNADTVRITLEFFSFDTPHHIHPFYRLTLFPVSMIGILLKYFVLDPLPDQFIIIIFSQIFINLFSILMFYRVLKHHQPTHLIAGEASILFIVSFPLIWLTLMPETYSISLLMLLASIHLAQIDSKWFPLFLVLTVGNNPVFLPFLSLLFIKKYNLYLIKNFNISLSLLFITIIILFASVWSSYTSYIGYFSTQLQGFFDNFKFFIGYVFSPWLVGPNFQNIDPFYVQLGSTFSLSLINSFILFGVIITTLLFVFKSRSIVSLFLLIHLTIAFILHSFIGFGLFNSVIYASLYSWAFIWLLVQSLSFFHLKKLVWVFIFGILLININWMNSFTLNLENQIFSNSNISTDTLPSKVYIDDLSLEYIAIARNHLEDRHGFWILPTLFDSIRINEQTKLISGLLQNSQWFQIDYSIDPISINVQNLYSYQFPLAKPSSFYIFGMGTRQKFIVRKSDDINWEIYDYNNDEVILTKIKNLTIDPQNYEVSGVLNSKTFRMFENEIGIFYEVNEDLYVLDNNVLVNIPDFSHTKYPRTLAILFGEVMTQLTPTEMSPNFIAYPKTWYRDATSIALVLKYSNNINFLEEISESFLTPYDQQNSMLELDNLGQLLFLMSLLEKPNQELINQILIEVEENLIEGSYLKGFTDFDYRPIYQTKWLKFGMNSLNLNTDHINIPNKYVDSYAPIMWLDRSDSFPLEKANFDRRWPYIYYANLNYFKVDFDYNDINLHYPISEEIAASHAQFDKLGILRNDYVSKKMVAPHAWSAAELFLLLMND
jgi:hypothetical protein